MSILKMTVCLIKNQQTFSTELPVDFQTMKHHNIGFDNLSAF
jgi:hypothetical protein